MGQGFPEFYLQLMIVDYRVSEGKKKRLRTGNWRLAIGDGGPLTTVGATGRSPFAIVSQTPPDERSHDGYDAQSG